MNDIFTGKLVRLSAYDPEEMSKAFSRWNRNSEYSRLLNSSSGPLQSPKRAAKWMEEEIGKPSPASYFFSIRTLEDKLIGELNLDVVDWSGRDAFVGLGIGETEYWSKGYGTDAMNILLRFAFTEINLKRVTLTVFEYNPRAIRSYEKAGFQHEGRLRKVLNKEGKRWDMLYMGILREEWLELTRSYVGQASAQRPVEGSLTISCHQRLAGWKPALQGKTMNTKLSVDETILDPSLQLRSVQWSDLEAVTQLIYDVCAADGDTVVAVTSEELRHEWETPGFALERDAFLVQASDGRIVGFEEFNNQHVHAILQTDGYVHPVFKGRGIGTALLRIVEQRARQEMKLAESELRVALRSTTDIHDLAGLELHRNEGYQPLRYHWRMEIVLNEPPAEPRFPKGIELRPFVKGEHDVAVWQAQNEAFRDHWGSHDMTLEDWRRSRFGDPEFDPTLWAIAWEGQQVAGFSLNRYRMGIGWIRTLGVRRPWRQRGLGEAILLHSFGEFYKRGKTTIGLGVDAQNPTGATRLYQKVGMVAASEFVTYEKELRPGRNVDEE